MAKSIFSAKELEAIDRHMKENNAKLMLSRPPLIYFKSSTTDEQYTMDLPNLVHLHEIGKIEDANARKAEKARIDRENKYKPKSAVL